MTPFAVSFARSRRLKRRAWGLIREAWGIELSPDQAPASRQQPRSVEGVDRFPVANAAQ